MNPEQPNERDARPRGAHLSAGQIRAYLDGEVRGRVAFHYGVHLLRCSACRKRRDSVAARGYEVATLLVVAGERSARPRRLALSVPGLSAAAIAMLSIVTLGVTEPSLFDTITFDEQTQEFLNLLADSIGILRILRREGLRF